MGRVHAALLLSLLCAFAAAQDGLSGKGKFPQVRAISGLPGGGAALRPNGFSGIDGALSLSTPIGYTLSDYRIVMAGGATSAGGGLRWFDGKTSVNRSNGSAGVMLGIPMGRDRLAVSVMQTSRLPEDRIVNVQFSPTVSKSRLGVSMGIQDVFDETVTTPDYHESARSAFVAGTYHAGNGIYVSAGGGTRRFAKGFAGISAPLGNRARAMLEHDGFGLNAGASVDLGLITFLNTHSMQASMFVGLCQGKYLTWSLALRN